MIFKVVLCALERENKIEKAKCLSSSFLHCTATIVARLLFYVDVQMFTLFHAVLLVG